MFGVNFTLAFASPARMAEKISGTASIYTTRISLPGFGPPSVIA
jgi:hypothetical protein